MLRAMPKRTRLDQALVQRGIAPSRERAQALVMAGKVRVGGGRADRAAMPVADDAAIEVQEPQPYVSRGGFKLAHALDHFHLDPAGLSALDVGASTGGFTDVLLQRGAARVCALDVGHNQLAWKLRQDARVHVIEGENARHLDAARLPFPPECVVCDVSFISLELVLPRLVEVGRGARFIVCLIKPQFEVGPDDVGKGGVVRDEAARARAVDKIVALARALGGEVLGVEPSPILGPAGNTEYLLAIRPPC